MVRALQVDENNVLLFANEINANYGITLLSILSCIKCARNFIHTSPRSRKIITPVVYRDSSKGPRIYIASSPTPLLALRDSSQGSNVRT